MAKFITRLRSVKTEGKAEYYVMEIRVTEKPDDELVTTLKEEGFEIQQNETGLEGQKTIHVYDEYHEVKERLGKMRK